MPEPCRHYIIMKSHDDIRWMCSGVERASGMEHYKQVLRRLSRLWPYRSASLSHIITFFAMRKRYLCAPGLCTGSGSFRRQLAPNYARNRIFIARTYRRRSQPFPKWHQSLNGRVVRWHPTNATHRRHGHFDRFYCRFHLTFASCRRTNARYPAGPIRATEMSHAFGGALAAPRSDSIFGRFPSTGFRYLPAMGTHTKCTVYIV